MPKCSVCWDLSSESECPAREGNRNTWVVCRLHVVLCFIFVVIFFPYTNTVKQQLFFFFNLLTPLPIYSVYYVVSGYMWVAHCSSVFCFLLFSSLTDFLFPLLGFGLYVGCTLFLCFLLLLFSSLTDLRFPPHGFGLYVGSTIFLYFFFNFLPLPIFSVSTPGRTPQHVRFPVDSHSCAAAVIAR